MGIATLAVGGVLAAMVLFSAVGKLRGDARIVHVIHATCGVPMRYFPLLATCEVAGAAGEVIGFWWRGIGVAAGAGLTIYFVGAVIAHLRVGDGKGVGPAIFLLGLSGAALVLRAWLPGAAI